MMQEFTLLGIDRHRIKTDGKGITSLVALAGCPLSCPYCINEELLADHKKVKKVTVQELTEELMSDHCYFLYTGGGVTFGGGEPLLQSEQIKAFSEICPKEWNITIETSLNVPAESLRPLLTDRFSFIIDCKAMQADIYEKYTGKENGRVIENLQELSRQIKQEQYVIKAPVIPGYSDRTRPEQSKETLLEMGIPEENIVIFNYINTKK